MGKEKVGWEEELSNFEENSFESYRRSREAGAKKLGNPTSMPVHGPWNSGHWTVDTGLWNPKRAQRAKGAHFRPNP